jgi:outer membrane beta-barrel protein
MSTHKPNQSLFKYLAILLMSVSLLSNAQKGAPLNKTLKPEANDMEDDLFKDMVVLQRKAMKKEGRFLLSSYMALDFSDGPYTMWGWNVNPGYAISEYWEIYASVVPFFIHSERDIVSKVESLNGKIESSKPKFQYGVELLWAPLYGKDSLGSQRIIRSDTFLKLGVHNIAYEDDNGLKLHLGLGKTYFINKYLGFRPAVSANYIQTIVDDKKEFRFFAI